jgi:predicted nucleic acid-binding protein
VKRVLDADILIGALDGSDAHHAKARSLLTAWHGRDELLISVVNLSEVLVAPAVDKQRLRRARTAIAALGVQIHQPGESIGVDAARLRQTYPISLPDAYCLATARQTGASLASFDGKVVRAAGAERIALAFSSTPTPRTPRSRRSGR